MKHSQLEIKTRSLGFVKVNEDDFLSFDHEQRKNEAFSGRKLKGFSAHDCKFVSCRFEKMRIEGGSFGSGREVSEYIDCSFDGSRIHRIAGGYARFERCSFRNVDLREWFCFDVEMINCIFTGRMRKMVFNGKPLDENFKIVHDKHNEFFGNDFSEAILHDVSFRTGIDLSKQKLPSGPEYLYLPDAASAVRQARAEILSWKDMELRRLAMILISTMEDDIRDGQHQMLLRAEDHSKQFRQSADAVFALLKRGGGGN